MRVAGLFVTVAFLAAAPALADLHALVVSGLGGEAEYERRFAEQADEVAAAAARTAGDPSRVTVLKGSASRRERLQRELRALAGRVTPEDQVLVVLIGHGSFDGEEYRFNLPGPDLTGSELGALLDALPAGRQLIINTTSASGTVAERWKRPNRIVITATRSGGERNATRFAEFWTEALSSADADVDKNEIVTAAEAFEFAARRVADAYKAEVALATEHARLEGVGPDQFTVARLGSAAIAAGDEALTALLGEQTALAQQLEALKARKEGMEESAYYDELEKVLVAIARLDRRIAARQASRSDSPAGGSDVPDAQ